MKVKHLIILIVLMLLYHYNVNFWFLFTHARKYFFIWGLYLFIYHRKDIGLVVPNKFKLKFILYTTIILIMSGIVFIRGELELVAIMIPVSFIINIFAAFPIVYYIVKWSKNKDEKSILNNLVLVLLFAIVVNNLIAISKLFIQPIYETLMSLQIQPSEMAEDISRDDAYRLGGWGDNLIFAGGTSSALGIILSVYKYCSYQSGKYKYLYLLIAIFILFSGILIARTTILGIPLACILLLYYIKNVKIFFKYLLIGISFCITVILIFFFIVPKLDAGMSNWAFEIVFNLLDDGEASSASTNDLLNMWNILPNSPITWIIGDGIFETSNGYYKGTDVGIMRIIFFIGIIGLFSILKLFRIFIYNKYGDKETRIIENVLYLWFFTMNLKGIFLPIHIACIMFLLNNVNKIKFLEYEKT